VEGANSIWKGPENLCAGGLATGKRATKIIRIKRQRGSRRSVEKRGREGHPSTGRGNGWDGGEPLGFKPLPSKKEGLLAGKRIRA